MSGALQAYAEDREGFVAHADADLPRWLPEKSWTRRPDPREGLGWTEVDWTQVPSAPTPSGAYREALVREGQRGVNDYLVRNVKNELRAAQGDSAAVLIAVEKLKTFLGAVVHAAGEDEMRRRAEDRGGGRVQVRGHVRGDNQQVRAHDRDWPG